MTETPNKGGPKEGVRTYGSCTFPTPTGFMSPRPVLVSRKIWARFLPAFLLDFCCPPAFFRAFFRRAAEFRSSRRLLALHAGRTTLASHHPGLGGRERPRRPFARPT